jgi:hypothetical protein
MAVPCHEPTEAFFVQQSVQPLVEGMPAAAPNIGGGDLQSLLALPPLSCAHGHAIAFRNPIKQFSTFMSYGAGHLQSIRRLLPEAATRFHHEYSLAKLQPDGPREYWRTSGEIYIREDSGNSR